MLACVVMLLILLLERRERAALASPRGFLKKDSEQTCQKYDERHAPSSQNRGKIMAPLPAREQGHADATVMGRFWTP